MYKVNQETAPNVFLSRFQKPFRFHPTRFSELNYVQPTTILKRTIEDHISGIALLAPKRNYHA